MCDTIWNYTEQFVSECNTILKNHRGVVESINFPRPYPFNRNCTYVIDAGLGNTINATFSHFELENHANCEYDYVMVSIFK